MESNAEFDLKDFENQVLNSIEVLKADNDVNQSINLLKFGEEKEKMVFGERALEALTMDVADVVFASSVSGLIPLEGGGGGYFWDFLLKELFSGEALENEEGSPNQEELEKRNNLKAAYEFLMQKDISPYICPYLKGLSNDAYDIGKVLVPALVPFVLAGTIALPLSPIFFGMLALIIAKVGISNICPDENKKDKQK